MLQGFGSRGFYKRAGFWDPSDKWFSGLSVQVLGTRDQGLGFREDCITGSFLGTSIWILQSSSCKAFQWTLNPRVYPEPQSPQP